MKRTGWTEVVPGDRLDRKTARLPPAAETARFPSSCRASARPNPNVEFASSVRLSRRVVPPLQFARPLFKRLSALSTLSLPPSLLLSRCHTRFFLSIYSPASGPPPFLSLSLSFRLFELEGFIRAPVESPSYFFFSFFFFFFK